MKKSHTAYIAIVFVCTFLTISVMSEAQQMLLGKIERKDLSAPPYASWFTKNYLHYMPQSAEINALRNSLKGKKIRLFMGTWCGDSQREVPAFLKILDSAGFQIDNIEIIGVDNADSVYKQSPDGATADKLIFRVPTFIIYENNIEVGRITERPITTLENDLLLITSGKAYTPFYHGVPIVEKRLHSLPADSLQLAEYASFIRPQLAGSKELNSYGYVLVAQKRMEDAIQVFRLNTFCYPGDANTWDSLAEAFLKNREIEKAKNCYRKLILIDPANQQALKILGN